MISLAVRNVLRNRRRSFFAGLAMIIGVGFVVFLNAFFNGFIDEVIKGSVEASLGEVQIHRQGFLSATSNPLDLDMLADEAFLTKLKSVPGVLAVAPRINFEGLINNGTQANVIIGLGVEPAAEYEVCPQRKKVEVDGALRGGDDLIVGAELARSMELIPGSSATLLSATKAGVSNALDGTLRSRLESPIPFASKRSVIVPLAFARKLLKMEDRATEIAVRTVLADAPVVADRLRVALGPEYDVVTWDVRDANVAMFVGRLRAIVTIVTVVLFVLILTFIVNSMLAAVYERVREIGTMLAVGVRRTQVMRMFLVEAMTLALLSSALGSAIGSAVVWYYERHGITLQPPGAKPAVMYPYVSLTTLAIAIGVSVVGAVFAALYPALKASRLTPVEALRAT